MSFFVATFIFTMMFLSCVSHIRMSGPDLEWKNIEEDTEQWFRYVDSVSGYKSKCDLEILGVDYSVDSSECIVTTMCTNAYDTMTELVVDLKNKKVVSVTDLDGP